MGEFNKQKLMDNIYALIQEKNMKIGELETTIGVSAGYISRLNKNTDSNPGIDIIWKIARALGVSTDTLVEGDLTRSGDNLRYMERFLKKLEDKTEAGVLEWKSLSIYELNQMLRGERDVNCPIIETVKDNRDFGEQTPYESLGRTCSLVAFGRNVLTSAAAHDMTVVMTETGYSVPLDEYTVVYLYPLMALLDLPDGGEEVEFFDLYMETTEAETDPFGNVQPCRKIHPLCNTYNRKQELEPVVRSLYRTISRHEYDLRINESVKDAMTAFLNQ